MVERMPFGKPQSSGLPEIRGQPMGQEILNPPEDEGGEAQERGERRLRPTAPIRRTFDAPLPQAGMQEPITTQQTEPAKSYASRLVKRGIIGGAALGAGGALLAAGAGLTAPVSILVVLGSAMLGAMLFPILSTRAA